MPNDLWSKATGKVNQVAAMPDPDYDIQDQVFKRVDAMRSQIKAEAIDSYKQENTQGTWDSRTNLNLLGVIIPALLTLLVNIAGLPSFLATPEAANMIISVMNGGLPVIASVFAMFGIKYRNSATKFIK